MPRSVLDLRKSVSSLALLEVNCHLCPMNQLMASYRATHQDNHRALFCPCTICENVTELGHMQDYTRTLSTDYRCYEPLVRCAKMVICVEGGNF